MNPAPLPDVIVDARYLGVNVDSVRHTFSTDGEIRAEFFCFEIVRVVRGTTKAKHVIITEDEDEPFEIGKRYFFEQTAAGPWQLHTPRLIRKEN